MNFFKKKYVFTWIFFIMIGLTEVTANAKPWENTKETYGELTGMIKDLITQTPLIDAYVCISGEDSSYIVFTDAKGKFTLNGLSSGYYEIAVDIEDYDTIVCPNVIVHEGSITVSDFSLAKKRGTLSGFIKGRNNKSIGNALVSITDGKNTFSKSSDSSGAYVIGNIYIGNYGITASLEDYEVEGPEAIYITTGFTTRDFILNRLRGEVYGKAIDSKNMKGIKGVFITISDGENSYEAVTDSNGDFIITDIYYGDYEINASLYGYEEKSFKNILIRGGNKVNYDIIF